MTPQEWRERTVRVRKIAESVQQNEWTSAFASLNTRAMKFLESPNNDSGWEIIKDCGTWGEPTDESGNVKGLGMLALGRALKPALEELHLEAVRFVCRDAIRDFRTQAERVLESFRFEMPEDYFRSLEARFVAVERSPPARNFILCKSESEFGKRYRGFGGSPSFALSGVNAFTTVWKNDPSPSPLNRLIVIRPAWTPQTLFHELLHWSTHREYDTAAKAYRGYANDVLFEGPTEYFTRRGFPDRGNFFNERRCVTEAIREGTLSEKGLAAAFFRGEGVTAVTTALVASSEKHPASRDAAINSEIASVLAGAASESLERDINWAKGMQQSKPVYARLSKPAQSDVQSKLKSLTESQLAGHGFNADWIKAIKGPPITVTFQP